MNSSSEITLTSLTGDALALGAHWIYSQREIFEKIGPVTGYSDPATTYHPGKAAGDFTHYGDQVMVLLRSLAAHGRFNQAAFADEWRLFWENPATLSYRDGATKTTLENLRAGKPLDATASSSNDIAGAARIAPLFLLDWKSNEHLVAAARSQTALTHGDPSVIETAEFFARVTLAVQEGAEIRDALREVAMRPHWKAIPEEWLGNALQSADSDNSDLAAVKEHGLGCHVSDAFPAICHLLLRHPGDTGAALAVNVEAGGDSAARGLFLGMIYGASSHMKSPPAEWNSGLRAHDEIQQLLQKINSHA